jgi:putative drug exporter of the RND superfamily
VQNDPGVAFVAPAIPSRSGKALLWQVIPKTSPQSIETEDLVHRLRDSILPDIAASTGIRPNVTGNVAANIDFADYLAKRLPLFFGAVLALSFLLLMAVFRSLLVPLKAVIMNLLSIGAAYGVVVAVFQWGWLKDLFGLGGGAPIEPWAPMMMFAIVFGLSMDYEVFLMSRMREEFDRHGDNAKAVADGLASTARVITAAAAIMVFVFGSFLLESSRQIKLFGLGLAMAVFLDATIVRMVLVPATMELLGARNWWLPSWLDKRLPRLNVEGGAHGSPATGSTPLPTN